MKKLLIALVLLILALPVWFIATGTISASSLSMILNTITGRGIETPATTTIGQRLQVPDGFSVNLYAGGVPNARFIQFTPAGDLLVSRPHIGEITLLPRNPEDPTRALPGRTLLGGLKRPSGLALFGEWLYIGESNAIGRVRLDLESGELKSEYEQIITGLTDDGNHPYKVLGIGPDRRLYLSQGSTCNVCIEQDKRRATLSRFNLDGSGEELVATGLRNAMGMDWTLDDGTLYVTDNGRDMLGDDYPPCELNRIAEGAFYGWPYLNGNNVTDPDFSDLPPDLPPATPPAHGFRAHNAPLGIRFVETIGWGEDYDKVALVALHGSWNRSSPDGYRVVSLHFDGKAIERRDFLWGFEKDADIIGRPVDVDQGPDGAIYISDDYAGAIYRVSRGTGGSMLPAAPEQPPSFVLETPGWLTGDNRADLRARGEALYQQYACSSCHLPGAAGKMDLETAALRLQYPDLIARLTQPTAPMPVFPLDESEKQALAVYLLDKH